MKAQYIVISSRAAMPNNCWGVYKHVAVLFWDGNGNRPRRIAARQGVTIVKRWNRLFVGKTDRCAYERALTEARALADNLNLNNRNNLEPA